MTESVRRTPFLGRRGAVPFVAGSMASRSESTEQESSKIAKLVADLNIFFHGIKLHLSKTLPKMERNLGAEEGPESWLARAPSPDSYYG